MAKFCGKCGAKLDEVIGLCPNCDADKLKNVENQNESSKEDELNISASESQISTKELKKQEKALKKELKKAKKASWSFGKRIRRTFLRIFLSAFFLVVLVGGIFCTLVYFDILDVPIVEELLESVGLKIVEYGDSEEINYDNYKIEPPNADEYFQQNSQIAEEINANDSDEVLTEEEAIRTLAERGFKDFPITTEYTMDGTYNDASEISGSSSIKHPIYTMYYVTQNNELWNIMIINSDVMAIPVSYNIQSSLGVQVVISESEEVTSYDSTTNKFYKNIPNESAMIVKIVEIIDAESLENLTIEVIDTL